MTKGFDLFELEEKDFDTVLATDINFKGNIQFERPCMIKGKITGSINTTSDLVIDSCAVINADIKVSRAVIKGTVAGNITGTKDVFVTSTGSLIGDVECGQLVLEPGSNFSGHCTMNK